VPAELGSTGGWLSCAVQPTDRTFPILQYVSGTLAATACTLAAADVVHGTVQVLAQIGLQEPNPAGRGTALR